MARAYLKGLELDEISLVDKGASGDAQHRPKVVLFKRGDDAPPKEKAMPKLEKSLADKLVGLFRKSLEEETQKDDLADIMAKLSPEEVERVKQALAMAAAGAQKAEEPKEEPNPMAKRDDVPEDVRKAMEAQEAENKALKKRMDEMEDANKMATFTKRAADLEALPGMSTEARAKLLKTASEKLTKEEFEQLEKSLRTASEAIKKGGLFKELGSSQGGEGATAYDKIKSIAKSLREKDAKLSEADALTKAISENPELAREYQAERA